MDRLRGVLDTIRRALRELNATQKLLIASLVVVMAMTLFLVVQYTGKPALVPLMDRASPVEQQQAARFLDGAGIPYKTSTSGQVMVERERVRPIIAQMAQRGALPADSSVLFNNLIDKQSWTMSSAQLTQLETIAIQNELARIIGQFNNVDRAAVLIDAPEPRSLGMAVRQPTASVTIFMAGNQALSQEVVDGAAGLVAGAKAGLDIRNVRVIDGVRGQQRRARSDDDMLASGYLEHSGKVEQRVRDRLMDMLSYIPGVIIAVNAQVDVRRSVSETSRVLDAGRGTVTAPKRETTSERVQQQGSVGAEPGVRPNTGLSIDNAGSRGNTLSDTQTEAEFETQFGRTVERITDPRGMPLKINATVNIPRSFFIAQWRAANNSTETPGDDALAPVIQQETARIRDDIQPQVDSGEAGGQPGDVVVSVIPDFEMLQKAYPEAFRAGLGGGAGGSGTGGVASIFENAGGVRTVVLTLLALAALGMMALTVRRATKIDKLPSPEELMGVPPALSGETDLVGEAGEADAALSGIELSDSAIQSQKVLEQVEDMVKQRPAEAAGLLNRWIQSDQ